jgi:curved DNA-binding protein CbpA
MSSDINKQNEKYFDMLELKPNASLSEIKCAYLHLKKLYSSYSPVLSTISDEISDTKRKELLAQIEEAYKQLKEQYLFVETDKQKKTWERVADKNIPEFEVFSGNALKLIREVLGVELQEISLATGIPVRNLQYIEKERFDLLPPSGYVRIYVTKYAEYLSLDTKRVPDDYMKAMDKKKQKTHHDKF